MKVSVVCCLSERAEKNKSVVDSIQSISAFEEKRKYKAVFPARMLDKTLKKSADGNIVSKPYEGLSEPEGKKESVVDIAVNAEFILCIPKGTDKSELQKLKEKCENESMAFQFFEDTWTNVHDCYNKAVSLATGEYVTFFNAGDTLSEEFLNTFFQGYGMRTNIPIYMIHRATQYKEDGAFRNYIPRINFTGNEDFFLFDLKKKVDCHPFEMTGCIIKTEDAKSSKLKPELGLETEREYLFNLCLKYMKVCYLTGSVYTSSTAEEDNITFYEGLYTRKWYYDSFETFWIPYFEKLIKEQGSIPKFIQYNFMYSVNSRIEGNLNNRNKHVIAEEEGEEYLAYLGKKLRYIDEDVMFNWKKVKWCLTGDTMKWVFGLLRNGLDYNFDEYYLADNVQYGSGHAIYNSAASLRTNIMFIRYFEGKLEIDGTVHPILYSMADEVYFMYDGVKYTLQYNDRYTMTKVFDVSICKTHPFHVTIPIVKKDKSDIFCCADFGERTEKINFVYNSHFSRVCSTFRHSHWFFGEHREYMMNQENKGLRIRKVTAKNRFAKEVRLFFNMCERKNFTIFKYACLRMLYFICKPFMTRKPIWMYIDKIYKGGDSSEYLYKYACSKKDHIKHYYLVDKKSTDYKRLKAQGYKPLVRDSLKHKLIFLYADMMVISNSTVFAFNGYNLQTSAYIRDLPHFHVCCVQHGMSVQKIAIAQNRLRDNTRLYFCASKYEIENLSKPVYDYAGYHALKLTGVPRYDGLVDRAKKQIMISPTWRMQAAMPVTTSEGEQRAYNPLFKESDYFKIYNSLINNPRLIEAAKKYGYRIKYVLHPIVSAQVEDFDKNDYVDIVPAVGDMSYEDMFCESALMVTDFSGIQFDFAYMRKPVVYLHHRDIPQHYEEGTYHYDTMAFGEICHDNDELIDTLIEYMQNDCKMKERYVKRADDFFYYSDHENCKRIYDEMIAYQDKYVMPFRKK